MAKTSKTHYLIKLFVLMLAVSTELACGQSSNPQPDAPQPDAPVVTPRQATIMPIAPGTGTNPPVTTPPALPPGTLPVAPKPVFKPSRIITRSHDGTYVEVSQSVRLLFDDGQTQSLKNATILIQDQLNKLTQKYNPSLDPNGDLKPLVNASADFSKDLDQVVDLATALYGDAHLDTTDWKRWLGQQLDPSGFIVFVTIEVDRNFVTLPAVLQTALNGGGSFSLAIVFVPQATERITLARANPDGTVTPGATSNYTKWSTSLVIIPTLNAGIGVSALTTTNARYGFGLIFGDLDTAADFSGYAFGGSGTIEMPLLNALPGVFSADGINLKILGVKNPSKPGAVNNYVALVGLEQSRPKVAAGPVLPGGTPPVAAPASPVDLEAHVNLSYIWDFTSFFGTIGHTVTVQINRLNGDTGPVLDR